MEKNYKYIGMIMKKLFCLRENHYELLHFVLWLFNGIARALKLLIQFCCHKLLRKIIS